MAVLPRCIKILTNLFKSVPDDIYSDDQNHIIIYSSLQRIYNTVSKIAKSSQTNERNFIFGNKINDFIGKEYDQSYISIIDRLSQLFSCTRELKFNDDIDNEISGKVCSFFIENFLKLEDKFDCKNYSESLIKNQESETSFNNLMAELKDRNDYLVILCYLFCQILFAHFYRKAYNEELTIQYPDRLLFNQELDRYQFSLPYEDQVTCSYFVYRYIYLPEERERQYTDRNKYDCGYHSSQQIKCSFRELNKIIDSSSNADGVTKLNTSYDNFVKKLLDLNVIKNCDNKSKNYGLLKLYMLFKKIKNRRDVVRSIKSNDKYGFDFFKMLNSIDIENFVFDDLPYKTANGKHCIIVQSEIKKEIELSDLARITSYYTYSMSCLFETLNSIGRTIDSLNEISIRKSKQEMLNNFSSELNQDVTTYVKDNKEEMDKAIFSEDVMQNLLSLIYFQAIEASLKMMIRVFQYVRNNIEVMVPNSTRGIFADKNKYAFLVSYANIYMNYDKISKVIGQFWPEFFPKENVRKKFGEYFEIIKKIHDEIKTQSYSHDECTFRFMVSSILVRTMAENGVFEPIPQQCYYHSGQRVKSISLYDLLKSNHYSTFKITMISTIFETVNSGLSGVLDKALYSLYYQQYYYNRILNDFIRIQKDKPKEGLERLYIVTENLFKAANSWGTKAINRYINY